MQTDRQADVGLYLRVPVDLDRTLRTAAAARNGGYLAHGRFAPFVVEVLRRGLGAIDDERRELEAREADAAKMAKRPRPRPRKRRK